MGEGESAYQNCMITSEIRSQVDRIGDSFWVGGISNPMEVIEQITYLLFICRLDDLHTLEENRANHLIIPMERRIYPQGNDTNDCPHKDFRWYRVKHTAPQSRATMIFKLAWYGHI